MPLRRLPQPAPRDRRRDAVPVLLRRRVEDETAGPPGLGSVRGGDVVIVDLFAGPGGMDVAAHALGAESVGIEWDEGAVATRKAAGLPTVHGDVRDYGPKDFPDADVLAGGPPCQTFTVAGK